MTTTTQPADNPLLVRTRPRPAGPIVASLTFSRRALLKIRHVPEQLGDAIGIPVLFTLMFTYMFGGALAGSTDAYLQDLLPGTMAMSVLMISVYAGINLNGDITRGSFDRFRTMPIWRPALIVGGLVSDVARNVLAALLVLGLGLVMGFRADGGVLGAAGAIGLILVFAFGVSWIWVILGLTMRSPNSVTMVSFLVQFPMTFLSNVFVDPSTMPDWLEAFVDVNPVSHLVTAVRSLMAGRPDGSEVGLVLIASAVLVAVLAPITMSLYRRR